MGYFYSIFFLVFVMGLMAGMYTMAKAMTSYKKRKSSKFQSLYSRMYQKTVTDTRIYDEPVHGESGLVDRVKRINELNNNS